MQVVADLKILLYPSWARIYLWIEHELELELYDAISLKVKTYEILTARAIEVLNFTPLNGKAIRIVNFHRDPSVRKSGLGNIFIKNLDKMFDQKTLHDTCSAFGNILSCKIATDQPGQLKGTANKCMWDPSCANKKEIWLWTRQRLLMSMNGKMVGSKPLYVVLAQRKEDRRARLQLFEMNGKMVGNKPLYVALAQRKED
ncbi:polyadenylate-binding protein 2-like protein [Tanacetum coccineum]